MAKRKGVFNDEELRILLSSLVEKPTPKAAYKFIQWCERARIGNVILERILKGDLLTKVGPDGSPACAGKKAIESSPALEPATPKSLKNIDITNQEYRLLLNMLQMADWILHAHTVNSRNDEYSALLQKIMAMAKDYGCGELVQYIEAKRTYYPTNEYLLSDEVQGPIDEHNDEIFWDELTDRLARRDVMREVGIKEYRELEKSERRARLSKAREKYDKEFSTQGLKRLELPETGKRKNPGGKTKTS